MLSTGEQEELNRLRDKYKDGHSAADTIGLQDAGAAKQAVCTGDESLAHVHLCHICQGSGVHTEVYEFRRLESTCKHCSGEGVMVTGSKTSNSSAGSRQGKQHKSKPASSNHSNIPSTAEAAGVASQPSDNPSASAASAEHKKWKAKRELEVLEQRIACITQEKAGIIAALAAGLNSTSSGGGSSGGSVQQALQENLVEQLQRHLDDLVAARAARQAAIGTA
uniref:CR-type domain-containing protein n=1 Tax=Tetradesmus obliquus TaxID=3088 RepID=A0A383WHC5_TETOB|eukprot:jgi/Sobl393_1/17358/SZX76811.1